MQIVPVTAAGGVLYKVENDSILVLLIYRRGVWDLPKGKLEGEESIKECAQREVSEEVGCRLPEIRQKLITTYHEYEEAEEYIGKTTHWYAMEAGKEEDLEPETEEDITKLAWFPLEEAIEKVGYQNLREVLGSFENWHFGK
ncbi:NUDIX domain-containing protein [Aliifodinibius sp. S!AR15-10]|uniref:NUDIX hydrolase n=1 Tax=Aliifodinibius sp. S!AR15-10 TaxID=2950437 RepID=UPI002857FC8F|nr:NUDIX domain-containing protein [Aliifodinibius sp. S!AR15-10]MDR8392077.1 NUDIX domain-containing protein [Aliifodinibius sp. S!AR15-10]